MFQHTSVSWYNETILNTYWSCTFLSSCYCDWNNRSHHLSLSAFVIHLCWPPNPPLSAKHSGFSWITILCFRFSRMTEAYDRGYYQALNALFSSSNGIDISSTNVSHLIGIPHNELLMQLAHRKEDFIVRLVLWIITYFILKHTPFLSLNFMIAILWPAVYCNLDLEHWIELCALLKH